MQLLTEAKQRKARRTAVVSFLFSSLSIPSSSYLLFSTPLDKKGSEGMFTSSSFRQDRPLSLSLDFLVVSKSPLTL